LFNKQSSKTILFWIVFILIFVSIWQIMANDHEDDKKIIFSEFQNAVEANAVEEVTITGMEIEGTFTEEGAEKFGKDSKRAFISVGVVDPDLRDIMLANKVKYDFKNEEQGSFWQNILITWLPMILIFLIFFIFMRQIQSGSGKAMSFGKSKARLLNESQNKITFADVAGINEAKEELQEIIEFLKDPKRFTRLGGRIPKGVLLMGPPGTGKTLLARGVAGEAGVPFFTISGSDFVEMFVGVGASRVRDLFEQGKKNAPCIIFIDEIDAVGRHRGAGMGGGHDEREQTLNQLLVEMDGFESNEGVILIAATNRPDVLDPALLRPGRFDRRVVVPRPDVGGRQGILKVHTRKTPLGPDVDLGKVARGTPGFSGADLENLVNEAALGAARVGKDRLEMDDFEDAKDKVMMGAERKSAIISDKEKRVTAYHEAGHALVAKLQQGTDPVHKVTIIPRGRALGLMQQLPKEDRLSWTRSFALKKIAVMMGGRVAEELIFGEITNGAGADIQMATDLSRKMITEWGMSDKMGPVAYSSGDSNPFLGRDYAKPSAIAEQTAVEIDREVRRIISDQYQLAHTLLYENLELLKTLAEALLNYEVLDAEEIETIVQGEDIKALRDLRKAQKAEKPKTPKTGYTSQLRDELRTGEEAETESDQNTDADKTDLPDTPTALEGES
jgi:cell division protease FtsH